MKGLFGAEVIKIRHCNACHQVSPLSNDDNDYNCVLQIVCHQSIMFGMHHDFQSEFEKNCDFCLTPFAKHKQVVKYLVPPKVLAIQIKRFSNPMMKIRHDINVPTHLILNQFVIGKHDKLNYSLTSSIRHIGEQTSSGHYTTVGKENNDFFLFKPHSKAI